ncbi:MAG: flagellar hook protein, partial [Lachnospiraceae bacterium]|nr:flagellar hook protein [Lachnospiraceae bacterium]
MDAAGLGVKGLNVSDETGAAATYAIDAIADAVSKVSSQRSALGAVQNRLEHTIANLDNV